MINLRKNRLFTFVFTFFLSLNSLFAQNDWQIKGFKKLDEVNPILQPNLSQEFYCPIQKKVVKWESKNVLNPCAIIKNGNVYLLYRAQDSLGTSRIGLAISADGIHFKKNSKPILYPDQDSFFAFEGKGGIEDPRIVETEDGGYFLTYTSYDGKTARLCGAFSKDLLHWEKIGPLFSSDKYIDVWSKSGAVIVKQLNNHLIAEKINGYYWMYFGDTNLFLAKSTDLKRWEICEDDENKERISVMNPRKGYFDSRLVEPGPYALHTNAGILLLYNGSNAANYGVHYLHIFAYAAGQALFEASNPHKLIKRSMTPFLWPNKPYEQVGEVNEVCFIEGLVPYQGKWFLYYGTADSKIAVATSVIK
jgi:predicted GH43/DUF377 family glycosyl hydrolase